MKSGDRVRAKKNIDRRIKKGMTGTILGGLLGLFVAVEFDDDINGNDCGGRGQDGHCWFCLPEEIEKNI